jgi:DNA-directed RNA polymerase alpha subunit
MKNAQPVDNLPKLSQPARQALATVGVTQLEHLTSHTEREIKNLHGMGPKGMKELHQALQEKGLSFKES